MSFTQLPTIDLTNCIIEEESASTVSLANQIREACEFTGFFYLKPSEDKQMLVKDIIKLSKNFFDLPIEDKLHLKNDEHTRFFSKGLSIPGTGAGYRAVGSDVNFMKDTRESYNIGAGTLGMYSLADIKNGSLSGCGKNEWPSEEILPGWRKKVEKYISALLDISFALRKLIAISLNLPASYFDQPGFFDESTWLLGFVHYLPIISNINNDRFGIRPHCDSGIFTLLVTDGNQGLEVCYDKSVSPEERIWYPVPTAPDGCFVVNLGKNLEYWTNNIFKATLHRVVNKTGNERFSVPFFYESNMDLEIKPLHKVNGKANSINRTTTPAQLLQNRLETNKTEEFD